MARKELVSASPLGPTISTNEIDDLAVTAAKLGNDAVTKAKITGDGDFLCPIGTILAWAKSITGVPTLPDGWLECDGSAISDVDSPMNGQNLPNIDAGDFLRGGTTSGATGGSATHTLTEAEMPAHTHSYTAPSGTTLRGDSSSCVLTETGATTGSTGSGDAHENQPPYYEIVWIMRIK